MINLPTDEVHVWYYDGNTGDKTRRFRDSLTPDERDEAAVLPSARADEFTVSRGGLRVLASLYTGLSPLDVKVQINSRGKPIVIPGRIDVNISHTGSLHVFAAAGTAVGIDLEKLRMVKKFEEVLRFSYTAEEADWVCAVSEDGLRMKRFLRLWCLKEAAVKALGLDMMVSGRDAVFNPAELEKTCFEASGTDRGTAVRIGAGLTCFLTAREGRGNKDVTSRLHCAELQIFPGHACALSYTGSEKKISFKGAIQALR